MLRTGIGRRQRYRPLLLAALFAVQGVFAVAVHAAPSYITDPNYTGKLIDGEAQFRAMAYTRPLPNPLTPAYIYSGTQSDEPDPGEYEGDNSKETGVTWYDITMREIIHHNAGLVDDTTGELLPSNDNPGFKVRTYGPTAPVTVNGQQLYANSYPGHTIDVMKGTPVKIVWRNELPPTFFLPVDKTIMCSPGTIMAGSCPENAAVVHVHGSHGFDHSDGLPEQWFTPNFAQVGTQWLPNDQFGPEHGPSPVGTFVYPMDQDASTIWYHDHATGITRLNAMAGLAGFFLVRDQNELAMQSANTLPKYPYEVPIAFQDHTFWAETIPGTKVELGQMAMPDQPLIVGGNPVLINGQPTPSIIPEFFGNVPLVNGVAWPKLEVEPRKYRMRFLNANDSRTMILRISNAGDPSQDIPPDPSGDQIMIIGNEQGFLNQPVKVSQLVIMPGMRFDVIIDFTPYAGTPGKELVLENIGADMPFNGVIPDPTSRTNPFDMGQLMKFIVNKPLNSLLPVGAAPVPNATVTETTYLLPPEKRYLIPPVVPAGTATQRSFLKEALDEYGRVKLTMDYKGYFDQITEKAPLGAQQVWEIANLTPDSHPMHLHLVKFRIVNREAIDPAAYTAILTAPIQPATPPPPTPIYSLTGVTTQARNYESGYLDTVECPPGQVTRIIATFDIPGIYVWHCHILHHEEFDMMRQFAVTTPARGVKITSNLPSTTLVTGGPDVKFTAAAQTGFGDVHLPGTEMDMPASTLAYEYRFSVKAPNALAYVMVRNWDASPKFSTAVNTAGTWRVKVEARKTGGTYAEANNELLLNAVSNVPVGLSFPAPVPSSQTTGSPVSVPFTASGLSALPGTIGPGPYDYQFSIGTYTSSHSGPFSVQQAWSSNNKWTWTPSPNQAPGIYDVRAEIRTPGTVVPLSNLTKYVTYTVYGPKPVGVTLSTQNWKQPKATTMSQVTFTAAGLSALPNTPGPGPYEYRFSLQVPGGSMTVKRDWSTTATWNWTPPNTTTGQYVVQVEVRQVGSTVTSGAKSSATYTVY